MLPAEIMSWRESGQDSGFMRFLKEKLVCINYINFLKNVALFFEICYYIYKSGGFISFCEKSTNFFRNICNGALKSFCIKVFGVIYHIFSTFSGILPLTFFGL